MALKYNRLPEEAGCTRGAGLSHQLTVRVKVVEAVIVDLDVSVPVRVSV